MISLNGGGAQGTYSGATLTQQFTAYSSGYFILALSRKIPNGASEIGLTTPTGFTKLSESIVDSTAQGLYIKQCTEGEEISISLPPDSRITLEPIVVPSEMGIQLQYLQNYRNKDSNDKYAFSYIELPYNANAVYGVEIEYKPNKWWDDAGSYPSILSGWIDDFTIGNYGQYRGIYLRYRTNEIYHSSGNVLRYNDWNTISVKDNKFTVNGSVLGTVDSSQPLGLYGYPLTVFNMGANRDLDHSANGQIRKVKVYGQNGTLLSTWYPFKSQYGDYGLYNVESSSYVIETRKGSPFVEGGITPSQQINYGISGDILYNFVIGADSYIYDSDTEGQSSFDKNGDYCAVYIGSCPNAVIEKDGAQTACSSRYISGEYTGKGHSGLLGGFSPYKTPGISFTAYSDYTTYEIKFVDEDSIFEKPKLGTIIRNGIRYTPEASKIIPTYNGTFINDFRVVLSDPTTDNSYDIIKYQTPSGYGSGQGKGSLEIGNTNIIIKNFSANGNNIFIDGAIKDTRTSYGNIILGGQVIPYNYLHDEYDSVMYDGNPSYIIANNTILGAYNKLIPCWKNGSLYDNVIIGTNNTSTTASSSWVNWIIGSGNDINNNGYANVFCAGNDNKYNKSYDYSYTAVLLGGGNEVLASSDPTSTQTFVGGCYNKLKAYRNSQGVIGLSNKVEDFTYINYSYYVNNSQRTGSAKDDLGRYATFVTGTVNTVYGGSCLCSGYYNTVNNDVGINTDTNFTKEISNPVFGSRCLIGNSNTIAGTMLTIGFSNQVTNGALAIIGEKNKCNINSSAKLITYNENESNWIQIYREGMIFGSCNQAENAGTVIGFLNNATSTNAVLGSSNTTTSTNIVIGNSNGATSTNVVLGSSNNTTYANTVIGKSNTVTNSSSSLGNVFGDNNNVSGNTGDVFGSNNIVSSGGCHVFGGGNTVNGGSYCVGFGNTAINGSTVFGSSNNVTGGGSWKVIGFSNALQGGGGPVIGNGNTFNSGNMTYGILGYNNTVESGGAAFGCNNNSIGGSNAIGYGNTVNSGSTAIGISNRITGGGGHYIVGIGNEANTTSTQIIGFSNTISAGLAIGKYLSNTDTNGSRITIGAYNNASVDTGTRVVFGDGTGTSDRHNLFISDYNHNTYFSGNIYGTNLPDAPDTAGTYTLQCVVTVDPDTSEVSKSYSWV